MTASQGRMMDGAAPAFVRGLSLRRLLAIARKEAIQLRRDPRSLAMGFIVPAAMILFFGYVISFDVKNIRLAVYDDDRTPRSRELVEAFQGSGWFMLAARVEREADVAPLLDRGRVRMVLTIPHGFQADLAARRPAPLQALVDGADANTASIALNYANSIVLAYSARIAGVTMQQAPIRVESRVWYNETLESSKMIVPGLIAIVMMIIAAQLTALTIAREWERGTMEQLAATPVHPTEIILGKLLPYLGIGLIDMAAIVAIGMLVFHVPLRGNPLLLLVMAFFFLVGTLGLGIFISAAIRSQLLATQTAMQATFLPSNLLSGFMYDIASMPIILQAISHAVPARYFITVARGIFLKGVGVSVLWPQGLAMVAFATIGLTLAVRSFRKEIT
jgi:ABC-2 type transport system permease protein